LGLPLVLVGLVGFWNLGAHGMLIWDEAEYASLGRSLANGEGYQISGVVNAIRPPLLPLSVAAAFAATGLQTDWTAKIPIVLFGLAAIVAVYWIVRRQWGPWPAFAAAWSLAAFPEFATRLVLLLSEVPFMALYAAALFSFYVAFQRGGQWFFWGWAFFALALSTRYTALLFGPTLILVFLYECVLDRKRVLERLRSRAIWAAPSIALLILAPWYWRQWLVSGDALVGVKYAATQIPTYNVAAMPWWFYFASAFPAMTAAGALLAVGGLTHGALIARKRLAVYALIAATVIVGWHTRYDYKEVRLVTAALPMLAVGVGWAVKAWTDRWSTHRFVKAIPTLLLLLMTAQSILATGAQYRFARALGEPSFVDAMTFIRGATDQDATLIAPNQPQAHWYSQRRCLPAPATPKEFRRRLDEADWVVITNFERGQPPYLSEAAKGLRPADTFQGSARIFKDDRYKTVLLRSEWVRAQIDAAEPKP